MDDPELNRLTEELRRIGRPIAPFVIVTKPPKMRAWVAEVLVPWQQANPEAEEQYHEVKARAVKRHDALEALEVLEAMRKQSRAYVEKWAGGVTAAALESPQPTVALDAAREWYASDSWVLVLTGGPGVGKTVGAAYCAREKWIAGGHVKWISVTEASMERLFGLEAEQLRTAAKNAAMLVLDDVGRDNGSEPWKAWLEAVLDARERDGRRTVLTTNASATRDPSKPDQPSPLQGRLGERIWDRLRRGGKMVGCGNNTMRRTERRLG